MKIRNKSNKQNKSTKNERKTLLLDNSTSFLIKEAYKSTRTNIIFSLTDEGCKRILLTSSYPKEGKTTTCANLGITFAQTGAKVLLIEADLRKPRFHHMFNVDKNIGLTNVLTGISKIEDVIIKTKYENLDICCAGHIPPNPAELLASGTMDRILDELSEKYDYILIDSPPINYVTDAQILSNKVNAVFLVVRLGETDYQAVSFAIQNLELVNVKPRGIIVNDSKTDSISYKYKYKYSYRKYSKKSYNYYNGY